MNDLRMRISLSMYKKYYVDIKHNIGSRPIFKTETALGMREELLGLNIID